MTNPHPQRALATGEPDRQDDWRCRICAVPIHSSSRWCTPCRGAWDAAHLHIDQSIGELREAWWNAAPDEKPDLLDGIDTIRYQVRKGLSPG